MKIVLKNNKMDITFQNIMPQPLASMQHGAESIWGNHVVLKHGQKIILNASSGKGKSTFTSVVFGLRKDFEGKLLYDQVDTSNNVVMCSCTSLEGNINSRSGVFMVYRSVVK